MGNRHKKAAGWPGRPRWTVGISIDTGVLWLSAAGEKLGAVGQAGLEQSSLVSTNRARRRAGCLKWIWSAPNFNRGAVLFRKDCADSHGARDTEYGATLAPEGHSRSAGRNSSLIEWMGGLGGLGKRHFWGTRSRMRGLVGLKAAQIGILEVYCSKSKSQRLLILRASSAEGKAKRTRGV